MREEERKEVCLYGLNQLAVILERPTGVWYYNHTGDWHYDQTKGEMCDQHYQEGILAIVEGETGRLCPAIIQYMLNYGLYTEEGADYIDSLFEKYSAPFLKVNREKLEESHDAWIYVTVDSTKDCSNTLSGFDGKYGVLTWNKEQKEICLYGLSQLVIILEQPTGVWYHNQTDGCCCHQRYQEGILAIIETGELYPAIAQYMLNNRFTEEEADHVDSLFDKYSAPFLKVNREKLRESEEAWIHVAVDCNHNLSPFSGFDCKYGVLTWDNSD